MTTRRKDRGRLADDGRAADDDGKILAHLLNDGRAEECVKPGDLCLVRVDGGYSHEFTTAQVDDFLRREYGPDYKVAAPEKFAVFEDHLLYTDGVKKMAAFTGQIQKLRDLQRAFQKHTGVRDYSARKGVSSNSATGARVTLHKRARLACCGALRTIRDHRRLSTRVHVVQVPESILRAHREAQPSCREGPDARDPARTRRRSRRSTA